MSAFQWVIYIFPLLCVLSFGLLTGRNCFIIPPESGGSSDSFALIWDRWLLSESTVGIGQRYFWALPPSFWLGVWSPWRGDREAVRPLLCVKIDFSLNWEPLCLFCKTLLLNPRKIHFNLSVFLFLSSLLPLCIPILLPCLSLCPPLCRSSVSLFLSLSVFLSLSISQAKSLSPIQCQH